MSKLQWVDRIVSLVWVGLSELKVAAVWRLYRSGGGFTREVILVILLMAGIWTYPLYTLGFRLIPGFTDNILYLVLILFVIFQVRNSSTNPSYLLYPIVFWVSFVTVYVILQFLAK